MKKYPLHQTCIAAHRRGDASSRYFVVDMRISPEDIKSGQTAIIDNVRWYIQDVIWMNGGYVLIVNPFYSREEYEVHQQMKFSTWNLDKL